MKSGIDKMIKIIQSSWLNGLILISLSLYEVWIYSMLFYMYHFTELLFAFRYPDWTLVLYIILGFLGVLNGLYVFLKKVKVRKGYSVLILLFLVIIVIDTFYWTL